MNCQQIEKLIHAYHDGELDIGATVRVDEHLADCPRCAALLRNLSSLSAVLRNDALRFQAPPALRERIRAATAQAAEAESEAEVDTVTRQPWLRHSGWAIAAAIAIVGLILALQIPRRRADDRMIAEITSSHVRSLMANHLMDVASTDQHTVKPWFAGKLDYSPQVVDLGPSGYPLIGGRLDVLDHRNVAAIIYQRRKHYINLFIWPADAESLHGRLYNQNGYHALGWTKSGMNYLAVSELGEKEFREFVQMIQDQTVDSRPGE